MVSGRSSLGYLRPYKRTLIAGVAMLLATNLFFLGQAENLKRGVDAVRRAHFDAVPSFPVRHAVRTSAPVAWRRSAMIYDSKISRMRTSGLV